MNQRVVGQSPPLPSWPRSRGHAELVGTIRKYRSFEQEGSESQLSGVPCARLCDMRPAVVNEDVLGCEFQDRDAH